ncbi:chemotaxis protein CheA [Pusillimonas sp. (ex Stolz et al. 2005)]|uniref:chemotaxis protein CheA n=1 Tax=Pusillimonas sp. (ex Stolz et al. 2005) TaxID=1979962 RepID=UPI0026040A55|nr:chemotaxis protein CheA [Pusillimonas sp. (ex Stolz et al. 2005)]
MSAGVDLSQFYETFFDEADELLADMEQILLNVDIDQPDPDQLNAIFRAAHSIKGGAGTFGCFGQLAETTHLLENLLDAIRQGELALRKDMIDLFLETKDVLTEQVAAYRDSQEPDQEAYERICAQLRELALEHKGEAAAAPAASPPAPAQPAESSQAPAAAQSGAGEGVFAVHLERIQAKDAEALLAEMHLLGEVLRHEQGPDTLSVWLQTTCSADDLEAVCCFIVNQDQIRIVSENEVEAGPVGESADHSPAAEAVESDGAQQAAAESESASQPASAETGSPSSGSAAKEPARPAKSDAGRKPTKESGTLRVGVEKVDQIINLVGELVITQAMLVQTASTLDPVEHDRLLNGIEQLERNARDLQESVMSIRMMPMDYVFSRFPRVVRESASRLGKQIKLTTKGQATELDKSLIERIIDPLTHLVRNSLDHGIETPDKRIAAGKDPEGHLTLSAQHSGGQIIIEVSDDGAGLNRDRILAKAIQQGFPVNENTPDEELWQLIFAPGFSTADKVTDISGRGVGMDVVRRNIQGMGGHIQLTSRAGQGTTTRIVLPLTLAILDGMTVQVGDEIFILPLSNVSESIQPTEDQLHSISEGDNVLHVRGEYLPLIALHEVFDVQGAQTEITRSIAVILQAEESRFALLVDHLVGQQQVVVKNLEANYRKIPGISAATILGDGSVALIVDVFALLRMTRNKPAVTATSFTGEKHHA